MMDKIIKLTLTDKQFMLIHEAMFKMYCNLQDYDLLQEYRKLNAELGRQRFESIKNK